MISSGGEQLGIFPTVEALKMSQEQGIDLVEVAPNANPPVCRLMDYGKYKYELKKQSSAKKQKVHSLKEVKFRPNIGQHDLNVKVNHMRQFLEDDHKTKVRIFFRGREIIHSELGKSLADRIIDMVSDVGSVDNVPKMEGKNLTMVITPKKKEQ